MAFYASGASKARYNNIVALAVRLAVDSDYGQARESKGSSHAGIVYINSIISVNDATVGYIIMISKDSGYPRLEFTRVYCGSVDKTTTESKLLIDRLCQ